MRHETILLANSSLVKFEENKSKKKEIYLNRSVRYAVNRAKFICFYGRAGERRK